MNSGIQLLKERRSVRSYQKTQIKEEELEQILAAGQYAPTGMGKQSPVIVVVQDPETREQLRRMNCAVMGRDMDPFYGAPTIVVVLADPEIPTYREDASLVIGNMMNAAYAVGVGSCWIHRAKEEFESDEGKALLQKWGLKESYVGVGHCILGYAEGELPAPRPRKENYVVRV